MSENEDSTMSEESDAGTSRSHQKEDILGKIPACLYGPENLRRSHSNPMAGALKQPKLLYLFKCIFNSF